jgi:hypothetical protein
MKINLESCKTTAQGVTKICYNEKTRSLNFRIECESLEDLLECVKIINGYNDFDWNTVNTSLKLYALFKQYYNPENPNNGKDLLVYEIGREGSPVMYIKYFSMTLNGNGNKYEENGEIKEFTQEIFEKNMRILARLSKADECDFGNDGCYQYCRLWWD